MITNVGKDILAKYLLGTAPAYASYVALGCGAKPVPPDNTLDLVSSDGVLFTLDPTSEANTDRVWIGAKINLISSGTGTLSSLDTIVTGIIDAKNFVVNLPPSEDLDDATLRVLPDASMQAMDFEMFRVPISSRGYVNDNGTNKIVLSAQLPSEQKYEISEIGIYSAGSNSAAGSYDSRVLLSFSQDEAWEYHNQSSAIDLPRKLSALDSEGDDIIDESDPVFETNSDNSTFQTLNRQERFEYGRFLNNVIMMRGDSANLSFEATITDASGDGSVVEFTTNATHNLVPGDEITVAGVSPASFNQTYNVASVTGAKTFTVADTNTDAYTSGGNFATNNIYVNPGSNHIHLFGPGVDLSKNGSQDKIKLAFALINKNGSFAGSPDSVRILVEFASNDIPGEGEFARLEANIVNGGNPGEYNLSDNRYVVVEEEYDNLTLSQNFSWDVVNVAKIYVSVIDSGQPSDEYYVALDGMRIDNTSALNPLYGLTGYSVVRDPDVSTIAKLPNTNNYVEFRFSLDVN